MITDWNDAYANTAAISRMQPVIRRAGPHSAAAFR